MNASPDTGVQTLLAALDAAPAPVDFFIRDDDAGWDDERLFALLACTEQAGVPIDLAVIPQAVGAMLEIELAARCRAAGGRIGLHQHGYSHTNHEVTGRKCEFGTGREPGDQARDLVAGRARLQAAFGESLDAFFTPPWNRCAPGTPALLAVLGYAGLSRDASAPAQAALPELRVDVDWCRQRRLAAERGAQHGAEHGAAHESASAEATGAGVATELARRVAAGGPVGLMLHHARMSDRELQWLQGALGPWRRHPKARWRSMRELLRRPLAAVAPTEEMT